MAGCPLVAAAAGTAMGRLCQGQGAGAVICRAGRRVGQDAVRASATIGAASAIAAGSAGLGGSSGGRHALGIGCGEGRDAACPATISGTVTGPACPACRRGGGCNEVAVCVVAMASCRGNRGSALAARSAAVTVVDAGSVAARSAHAALGRGGDLHRRIRSDGGTLADCDGVAVTAGTADSAIAIIGSALGRIAARPAGPARAVRRCLARW